MALIDYDIPQLPRTINERKEMRTVSDAIAALQQAGHLPKSSVAQIRIGPLGLPSGEVTSVVVVIAQEHKAKPSWGVALPSSKSFLCRTAEGHRREFDITRLSRAWVFPDGDVVLSDGTCVRAVEMVPTPICHELTEVQKQIVYWTLKLIGAEQSCFRGCEPNPELVGLDYSTLYGLNLPRLSEILDYIRHDWVLRGVTRQTVADALRACGMRRPRFRPGGAGDEAATLSPKLN